MSWGIMTPLGEVRVYTDDVLSEFEIEPHVCKVRSVAAKPPAGCWRITVPAGNWKILRCIVVLNDPEIPNSGSSGQRYLCSEFVRGNVVLTIGAGDELDGFETNRLRYGMEYIRRGSVHQVSFGAAWATDYEGPCDISTQLATDLY